MKSVDSLLPSEIVKLVRGVKILPNDFNDY